MAQYDYQCYSCGEKLTLEMKMSEYKPDNEPICPKCGKERMKRVIDGVTFHLVGNNWAAPGKGGY